MKVKSNLVTQIKQKGIKCTPTQYKKYMYKGVILSSY